MLKSDFHCGITVTIFALTIDIPPCTRIYVGKLMWSNPDHRSIQIMQLFDGVFVVPTQDLSSIPQS